MLNFSAQNNLDCFFSIFSLIRNILTLSTITNIDKKITHRLTQCKKKIQQGSYICKTLPITILKDSI